MKLYEIANEYLAFLQAVEEGEIPEEAIADTLESITAEIEVKADNIACILKTLTAEVNALKEEEDRLAERRKVKENYHNRLKTYLSEILLKAGLEKVETTRNLISFRKSESVVIEDEAEFIAWAQVNRGDLLKYTAPSANKTKIKNALKGGATIIGAELRVNKNMQIK